MRIELFYTPGRPIRTLALERIRAALPSLGIAGAVTMIEAASSAQAERLEFPGSPTEYVNGADADAEARTAHISGLTCRLHAGGGTREGTPPVAMIVQGIPDAGPGWARASGQAVVGKESD